MDDNLFSKTAKDWHVHESILLLPNLSKDPEIADPIIIEQIFNVIGEEVYRITYYILNFVDQNFQSYCIHIKIY